MASQLLPTPSKNPDFVQIVQISDLHLFDNPHERYNGIDTKASLDKVMALVQKDFSHADLLAVTGDLLQNPNEQNYTEIFDYFDKCGLPYVAIAGNHDVTMELDAHLPFFQRCHVGLKADNRLKNCYKIDSDVWQIIFLDSSHQGHISGFFNQNTLDWLANTLQNSNKPCVIFCHHPMFKVNSAWIDHHRLKNADDFWQTVAPFCNKIQGIFVGHVHQDFSSVIDGVPVSTCPATSAQFKPLCDDYAIDDVPAGLRWITLYNNGTLETGVKRIDAM